MRRVARTLIVSLCVQWVSAQGTAARPGGPPAAVAGVVRQAEAARAAAKWAEAARLYNQAAQAAPKWAEGWFHAGSMAHAAGRYEACRDAMRRFLELEPGLPQGYGYLGLCEVQTKNFTDALTHLEMAQHLGVPKDDPLVRPIQMNAAMLYTKAGLFEGAMPLCRQLEGQFGESPELVALAGLTVLRRPIFPAELAAEDRALVFLMGRAALTAGAGKMEQARRMMEGIVKEYGKTPGVHYGYASVLLAGDPDACAVELGKELEVDPGHLPSLVSMAVILKRNEKYDEALGYLERALQVKPGDLRSRYQRASIYLAQGKAEEARVELEAVAKEAPSIAEVHTTLASAYYRLKRKEDGDRERAIVMNLKQSMRPKQFEAPASAEQGSR